MATAFNESNLSQSLMPAEEQEALQMSEVRYRRLFESARDGILILDALTGKITDANPFMSELLGYSHAEFLGKELWEIGLLQDMPSSTAAVSTLQQTGYIRYEDLPLQTKDGQRRDVEFVSNVYPEGERQVIQCNIRDITQRREAERALQKQLKHQAFHDPLTGLPNRILFLDRLEHALARLRRQTEAKEGLAVLFLDLDRFKVVNDSLGHATGDNMLIETARRLQSELRPGDTAARLGGDEFIVLLEEVQSLAAVVVIAERIAEVLQQPLDLLGHNVHTTASIGIVFSTGEDGSDAESLISDADVAMYRAKANGRAQHVIFSPEMNKRALERLHLENDLRQAVERGEFCLHYQPKLNLAARKIVAFEALVRWEHPVHGLVPPLDFIPLAEETGLIIPLGSWVLRTACRQAKLWMDEYGFEIGMSINISARQFHQPNLAQHIQSILVETELPPKFLKLEITESVVMEDAEQTNRTLQTLYDLGIQLAIDDFGTGYSSLSYLSRFPVTSLKIDRSFIKHLGESAEDTEIVRAIVMLAKALKLETVAEGIEDEQQLNELRALGCDRGQGYLFSRPVRVEDAAKLLEEMR